MKNKIFKVFKVLLFVVQAIPIPFSLISWVGTLITIAGGVGTVDWLNFGEALGAIIMMLFFVFVGIYPLTYIVSLCKSIGKKGFSVWMVLPIIHVLAAVSFYLCLLLIE